jgi:hypothetical protein
MTKLIFDLFEDEGSFKNLVDMLSISVLQVAKKDGSFYPPTIYTSKPAFFLKKHLGNLFTILYLKLFKV